MAAKKRGAKTPSRPWRYTAAIRKARKLVFGGQKGPRPGSYSYEIHDAWPRDLFFVLDDLADDIARLIYKATATDTPPASGVSRSSR